jgi:hypothetical protein
VARRRLTKLKLTRPGFARSVAAELSVGPTLQHGQGAKRDRGDYVWLLRILAQPGRMRFDGVECLRADTHRGWGIASMTRTAARLARFS